MSAGQSSPCLHARLERLDVLAYVPVGGLMAISRGILVVEWANTLIAHGLKTSKPAALVDHSGHLAFLLRSLYWKQSGYTANGDTVAS